MVTGQVVTFGRFQAGKTVTIHVHDTHLIAAARPFALVENVVVTAGCRRSGVGSALLRAAVSRSRQAGCYKVQLLSRAERHAAYAFYESHGFHTVAQGYRLYLD